MAKQEWESAPTRKIFLTVLGIGILGVGWWYVSKRSDCEGRIAYIPPQSTFAGDQGAYYRLSSVNPLKDIGGGRRFASHREAMTACLWD